MGKIVAIPDIKRLATLQGSLSKLHNDLHALMLDFPNLDDAPAPAPIKPATPPIDPAQNIAIARILYKVRGKRAKEFHSDSLFADPAWDMILDLFIAHYEGRKVSVSSVCIASQCPSTTALRWLGVLEHEKLVERHRDRGDARRVYVQLTEQGLAKANRALNHYRQLGQAMTEENA